MATVAMIHHTGMSSHPTRPVLDTLYQSLTWEFVAGLTFLILSKLAGLYQNWLDCIKIGQVVSKILFTGWILSKIFCH